MSLSSKVPPFSSQGKNARHDALYASIPFNWSGGEHRTSADQAHDAQVWLPCLCDEQPSPNSRRVHGCELHRCSFGPGSGTFLSLWIIFSLPMCKSFDSV